MSFREGPRYASGCTGSAVWSQRVSLKAGHSNPALDRRATLRDDLQQIDYLGSWPVSCEKNPLSAHFELHIEQGRRLENEKKTIGVVDSVQGIRWYKVIVRGEQAHAGSTTVADRADAVVATSKFIVFLESFAIETGVYATVGVVEVQNGSSNVVSGSTYFTVDLRHPNEDLLDQVEESVIEEMNQLSTAKNNRVTFAMEKVWHSPAVTFTSKAIQCVAQAGCRVVGPKAVMGPMISYAGHDSALVSSAEVPTAMIFVPSRDGLSHCPDEWTSKEDW
jgi:hydantoinase/carbamoylase family amidase